MIEIFTECAFGNRRFQVTSGRRHDAHVDRDFRAAANALEGLIDQDAQNLVLCLARQVGNVVDEQRAAVRLFQGAGIAGVRDGASPLPSPQIMVHINNGADAGLVQWFFDSLNPQKQGIAFDLIGLSYYPDGKNTLAELKVHVSGCSNACGPATRTVPR